MHGRGTMLCDRSHSAQVLAIINDAILNTTALWEDEPRSIDSIDAWFAAKEAQGFPIIGFFEQSVLAGFATYGPFRLWPGYRYSVEHSVYVHRDHRRRGIGHQLVKAVLESAQGQGFHNVVAGIDADNEASIRLHARLGFRHCGTIHHAGYKFGRWLDLTFMQRLLPSPAGLSTQ